MTHYTYDDYGRVLAIVRPGDEFDTPSAEFQYDLSDPVSRVVSRQRTVQNGDADLEKAFGVALHAGAAAALLVGQRHVIIEELRTFDRRKAAVLGLSAAHCGRGTATRAATGRACQCHTQAPTGKWRGRGRHGEDTVTYARAGPTMAGRPPLPRGPRRCTQTRCRGCGYCPKLPPLSGFPTERGGPNLQGSG